MGTNKLPVISLFSGGLGLDLGLEAAGFEIRVAVECNPAAAATIRKNRPTLPLIDDPLEEVTTARILKKAGLAQGEPFVVTGGPCCQSFSTAGRRKSVSDPRGSLFKEFIRVVRQARPRFFVMENVKGVLSAAVRHRPLNKRGPDHPPLADDEKLGSGFVTILKALRKLPYYTVFDLLNAADYGVAQARERVIFIGSRDGKPVAMPVPTHARDGADGLPLWRTLQEALEGLEDTEPVFKAFIESKLKFLRKIPEGGNWRNLPKRDQKKALGGAYTSWGGRLGFFRRLAWNRHAPALTTQPDSKATMLCHPDEDRPLTVAEYTRLQQFPDDWDFEGGVSQQYTQAGNAVPVGLGEAIGRAILLAAEKRKDSTLLGKVECADPDLARRMAERPATVLNPIRMRRDQTLKGAREWMGGQAREGIGKFLGVEDRDAEAKPSASRKPIRPRKFVVKRTKKRAGRSR